MNVATVDPPHTVLRVARVESQLRFSRISPADNHSGQAGNRYDVVGGGVLYAATHAVTCFRETLARFRPTPAMRELLKAADPEEPHFMVCGGIPQDWRLTRRLFTLSLTDALPFVDIEAPETMTFLEEELASTLGALGYKDNLDLSDLRNRDRRLSRAIAEWAYSAQDEAGNALYSEIKYRSRVDQSNECWAIFDGTAVDQVSVRSIDLNDQHMVKVANSWQLRVF